METEDKNRLIKLGEDCAGMKIELGLIKEILDKLSSTQSNLNGINERFLYMEKEFMGTKKDHANIFISIGKLEKVRTEDRLKNLEANQKWLVLSLIGAIIGTIMKYLYKP